MSMQTSQALGKTRKKPVVFINARPVNIIGWANTLFSDNHNFRYFEPIEKYL